MTTTTMRLHAQAPTETAFRTAARFAGNLLYALVAVVLLGRADSGKSTSSKSEER